MGQTEEIVSIKQRTKEGRSQTEWTPVAGRYTAGRAYAERGWYLPETRAYVQL